MSAVLESFGTVFLAFTSAFSTGSHVHFSSMGCTPSTQSTGTSLTPDADTDSHVLSSVKPKKTCISATTFTCPSESDEGQVVACGHLFDLSINCCRYCHRPSHSVASGSNCHTRISASLTGLHSHDLESTGLVSVADRASRIQTSLRSSCASLCSVCQPTAPLQPNEATAELVSGSWPAQTKQENENELPHCNNNNNSSTCFTCGGKKASNSNIEVHNTSLSRQSHLSPIVCHHRREENTNCDHSSTHIINKGEKKRKTHSKKKLSEVMRLNDTENFAPINATLNNKDKHNRAAVLSNLNDTITKESAAKATTGLCCVRHQHRYYRQIVNQHRFNCTVCSHQCCFIQLSSMASSLEYDPNRSQSAIYSSAPVNITPFNDNTAAHLDSMVCVCVFFFFFFAMLPLTTSH